MNVIPTVIVATFTGIYVLGSFTVPYLTGPTAPNLLGPSMSNFFSAFNQPQQAEVLAIVVFVLALGIGAVVRLGKCAHRQAPRDIVSVSITRGRCGVGARVAARVCSPLALVVASLLVFMVGPIVWLGLRAFSGLWLYPQLLPKQWTVNGWRQVFDDPNLSHSMKLSFEFAPVVTVASAVICLPAAYAFSRYKFPGRRVPAHLALRDRTRSRRSGCTSRWQASSTRST